MAKLFMPLSVRRSLEKLVQEGYPHETCGLLIGRQSAQQVEVQQIVAARNLNAERAHDRYEIDPEDFLCADRNARAEGLEIVGVWHSHPDHPARPSETDHAAAWQGWSYVIVSVTRAGIAELRSWRLNGEQFEEEAILS